MKIIIVDDNKILVRTIERVLKLSGISFELHGFTLGSEALDALDSGAIDPLEVTHVISDIGLPEGEDGFSFLKEFWARFDHEKSVRVLMITGSTREGIEGAEFLNKPFSIEELKSKLGLDDD